MRYKGVQVPEGLAERVKRLITLRKELGYTSVKEFIQDSVRRRVEQVQKLIEYEERDKQSAPPLQECGKASETASNSVAQTATGKPAPEAP
jgi:predicted component of type VI protein secretion system